MVDFRVAQVIFELAFPAIVNLKEEETARNAKG